MNNASHAVSKSNSCLSLKRTEQAISLIDVMTDYGNTSTVTLKPAITCAPTSSELRQLETTSDST